MQAFVIFIAARPFRLNSTVKRYDNGQNCMWFGAGEPKYAQDYISARNRIVTAARPSLVYKFTTLLSKNGSTNRIVSVEHL